MHRSIAHRIIVGATASALVLTAASCGSSKPSTTTAASTTAVPGTSGAQVVGPIMLDPATLDGQTVTTKVGRMVVFTVTDPTTWTATVEDPKVAAFQAGKNDGSATFNPGLVPVAPGTTKVTVTDGTTTATFTLVVE